MTGAVLMPMGHRIVHPPAGRPGIHTLACAGCLLWLACCSPGSWAQVNPIQQALAADHPALQTVMRDLSRYGVQILFTEITRGADGVIDFLDHSFGLQEEKYFYPASTVKLPVALLALEKLEELDGVNRYSRYTVGQAKAGSNLTRDLIQLLVVSDDAAYNRLFELLGKDEINRRLQRKGLNVRIAHRLSVPRSGTLETQRINFSRAAGSPLVIGPVTSSPIEKLPLENLLQGSAYWENSKRIQAPFDFAEKNYLPLNSLHEIMKRLVFPQAYPEQQRFHLSEPHRQFVLRTLRRLPREAGYDESEYPDRRFKYLLHGDSTKRLPGHLAIYNKIGRAYGYLTDSAYIVDQQRHREFLLSATIHVNANGTFNDDQYEYAEIGVPFLAELGRRLVFGD